MNQQIVVRVDRVYGNQTVYPVCEKARHLANLAGTRTFTPRAIETIRALGYEILVEAASL